jgi:hypothetical protein
MSRHLMLHRTDCEHIGDLMTKAPKRVPMARAQHATSARGRREREGRNSTPIMAQWMTEVSRTAERCVCTYAGLAARRVLNRYLVSRM